MADEQYIQPQRLELPVQRYDSRPSFPGESIKVRFINCCDTSVQILWVTYEGGYDNYKTLRPREFLDVDTFLKHTWIFKEEETGATVMANNKSCFYGFDEFGHIQQPLRDRTRFGVALSKARVEKLEKICINFICRRLEKSSDVDSLEIPNILKKRLVKQKQLLDAGSRSTDE